MRAVILEKTGKPPVVSAMPEPRAHTGQVVVEIEAAALNHRDVWIVQGKYPGIRPGTILGSDGAGRVDGRPVLINPSLNWGDDPRVQGPAYEILGMPRHGTFAEYVAIESSQLVEMPGHLSFAQGAALPLAGLTAWRALFTKGQPRHNDRILISGVGGGVALMACQFALAAGYEVWVTSGHDAKIEKAQALGARGGVNYRSEAWHETLRKQAGLFDIIIDSAGGAGFAKLAALVAPAGRIVIYGGTLGPIHGLVPQLLFWRQASILGTTMGTPQEFEAMVDFVARHRLVPVVDSVWPLEEAPRAFERMAKGEQFGKIVLEV